jgi:hypothetical protein
MKPTNIVVKGKRPGQEEFHYYNRFFADNAEVNGNPDPERATEKLRTKAEKHKTFWLSHEPAGTIIVVESEPIGEPKPIKASNPRTPTQAPFLNRAKGRR